jgi:ribosome assembly protein SQT1
MSGEQPKYETGDEILEEVIVSEDAPMDDEEVGGDDDDASTVWTDVTGDDDGMEGDEVADSTQPMLEELEDMSAYTFRGHSDSVYCAAINQVNGMIITGGGDDKSFLWTYDPISQSVDPSSVKELSGHTDTVTSVGFNFDGTLAMSGSYDGTIKVWNTSSAECVLTLEGPEDIEWAMWHQKGNAILAGSSDGTIWMWLTQGGQCVQVFAGHDGGVACGCFTSDGKTVCSGGDDGTIRIWGPKTGQCKHVFEGYSGHEATVTTICSASYDEDLLLTGTHSISTAHISDDNPY